MAKRDKRRRRKTPANGTFDHPPRHEPTPEEIRQRCWEIQDEWDAATRYARATHVENYRHETPTVKRPILPKPGRE